MLSTRAEPEKQYALVQKHVNRIRSIDMLCQSPIIIMVERNLGFEVSRSCLLAHARALLLGHAVALVAEYVCPRRPSTTTARCRASPGRGTAWTTGRSATGS